MAAKRRLATAIVAIALVGGGIAVPYLLATELDPRIGIPAAAIVGAAVAAYVLVLIAYWRRSRG